MTELQKFGGGGETFVHPVVVCAMLLAAALIFTMKQKSVLLPFFTALLLIPGNQVLILGPFHFQMMRILILFGWTRMFLIKSSSHEEIFAGGMNAIDKALIYCTVISAVDFVLLFREWGALNNQLGALYTVLGLYFLFRFFIRDQEDVEHLIRGLAYIAAVIALIMVFEQVTGRTPYAFLGRTVAIREGSFRSCAAFGHPILAGTFGAITFPMFAGIWSKRANRKAALVGMVAASLIALASASSTPILAWVMGIMVLCMWPVRKMMRVIRWGLALTVVSLHLVMKAPVWALIGRIDVMGGNSAGHRYMLVDNFIRRFGDWWLLGVKSTTSWGWDMFDLANQYVAVGEVSGLLPFIFFMAIIVYGFKYIGKARKAAEGNREQERFIWALGAAMFANVVDFFGISYWDQNLAVWLAFLVIIQVTTLPLIAKAAETPMETARPSLGFRAANQPRPNPEPSRGALPLEGAKDVARWRLRTDRVR